MAVDFTGITKRRVQRVPYVRPDFNQNKSNGKEAVNTGHATTAVMSGLSSTPETGHTGHCGTQEGLRNVDCSLHCNNRGNTVAGHAGHTGHTFTDDDAEFFNERAAIAEFDGGLSHADAEAQAFQELQVWRNNRIYH